jgi:hypothetical protein
MKFKKWLLNEDIFGFDDVKPVSIQKPKDENPIIGVSADPILSELSKLVLGYKKPVRNWHNIVEWGTEQPGSLKVLVTPIGSTKIIVRRLTHNLLGEQVWVCKKIIPLRESYKNQEIDIALDLREYLLGYDKELLDTPAREYKNFGKLVTETAILSRRNTPVFFIYQGVRKLDEYNYIIHFDCRGQGVEAPTAKRVEEFCINVSYQPMTGMIRSWGYEVNSPTRRHVFLTMPSEWDEYFTPSQSVTEIAESIAAALSIY